MGLWSDKNMNLTDFIYTFPNGSWIEFFPATDDQRLRGRKRMILYVNEANELSYDEWTQLKLRTTLFTLIDYNPSFDEEHWIVEKVNNSPRTKFFISTYKDNPFLEQSVIDSIEELKDTSPSLWQVYGLGQRAIIEGRIFKTYEVVDELPPEARRHRFIGLDFGYSCFRGDTLITTLRGDIPIKDVVPGDFVLTRHGYHRVKHNIYNGIQEVVHKNLATNLGSIDFFATFGHNFNANGKWKKYGELTAGDRLFVLSPLTERNTAVTPTASTQTTTITSGSLKESITSSYCTTQFISSIAELYQRAKSYTTRTATRLTTTLATLWQSLHLNIKKFTAKNLGANCITVFKQKKSASQKTIGTNEEKCLKQTLQSKQEFVNGAERHTRQQTYTNVSAQNTAITSGSTSLPKTTSRSLVSTAERSSKETSTLNQKRAATSAHILCCGLNDVRTFETQYCPVYDLEIEDVHEYFANGVLVHNCDPTAIVMVSVGAKCIYLDELCYRTQMGTNEIIAELKLQRWEPKVWADSSEPREIDEIYNTGIDIHGVKKYAGSVRAGLQKMQQYRLVVTRRSTNLIKELKSYVYRRDKNGKWLNEPVDAFNHCFTADTPITTEHGLVPISDIRLGDNVLTSDGFHKVTKLWNNGQQHCKRFTLVFADGRLSVKATPEHLVRTGEKWQKLECLHAGDVVFTQSAAKGLTAREIKTIFAEDIGTRQVFDLEVEGRHEYLASGLLVHNCIDAIRYVVLEEVLGQNGDGLDAEGLLDIL